jgi:hypothetical protein
VPLDQSCHRERRGRRQDHRGAGHYGDVDSNGMLGGPGDETPAPGCGCMLAINKAVSVTSSDGAAATVIDARSVAVAKNVLLITNGGEFGKPGKGFTVTSTKADFGDGIVIDSNDVAVRGNLVVGKRETGQMANGHGILTVSSPETILIDSNQVVGWDVAGIDIEGTGKTIRKNHVSGNKKGIVARGDAVITGNVATANVVGIELHDSTTASKNAARGDFDGIRVPQAGFGGTIEKNEMSGNSECGLSNAQPGLHAPNNYWGAATGPGPAPADRSCDEGAGTTVTTPFATKPFNVKVRFKP